MEIEIKNHLSENELLKTSFIEWKIEKTEFVKEVAPSKPSGYYHFFESDEDEQYFCVRTKIKNKTDLTMNADNIQSVMESDGKSYKGVVRFETSNHKDLTTEIKGNEELTAYVFFKVSIKNNETPKQITLYYEENIGKQEEEGHYRYQTDWKLK